jgi:hypothetical protein
MRQQQYPCVCYSILRVPYSWIQLYCFIKSHYSYASSPHSMVRTRTCHLWQSLLVLEWGGYFPDVVVGFGSVYITHLRCEQFLQNSSKPSHPCGCCEQVLQNYLTLTRIKEATYASPTFWSLTGGISDNSLSHIYK